ncbi:TetR/AcrR family transcriptional regulator [Lederbergia panacisoli]|uniref:TetR/AcrR family transcriptional regulator n=1 Tax=Lederbergia panacisoli TaxID=1255251 RepID=UPI00214A8BBA|nr:TetR/AcrR family transcriptional regulator [Lederbergia panacisoli]MCR2822207.1 TetR/AcrR family transcriptional regulator [Lederbergia panacisoli]
MEQKQRPIGRPRQDEQAKPTKNVILDVATRLFLEHGYQLVSMDDVAQACGVTKATVYYYYSKKAELFTDAMVKMMMRIRKQMNQILSSDRPLKERLYTFADSFLRATIAIDVKSFFNEANTSLSVTQIQEIKNAEKQMYKVLEEALEEAMLKGEISQGNSKLAAHAFVAILTVGNYKDADENRLFPIDEMAKQLVGFYWNGLVNK